MAMILCKRVYEPASADDGFRILVDRLWPRGIGRDELHIDEWLKEVAPSNHLRKWFNHDVAKFPEFTKKYRAELQVNPAMHTLRDLVAQHPVVTLLYGARDTEHNQAVVLKEVLT